MTSDTPSGEVASPVRRMEVVMVGSRQRWSDDTKRMVVRETFAPGASVSAVARKHGVTPSLVFSWRKRMREELGYQRIAENTSPPCLVPLATITAPSPEPEPPTIEIDLGGMAHVWIKGPAPAELVDAVLRALRST